MWPSELIPDDDFVFRQAHISANTTQISGKRIPNESHFTPDPDGLSVYWDRYADVPFIYKHIALSYKFKKAQYKNASDFKIYRFPVEFIRRIANVQDVIHSPVYNGNPAPVGEPNNQAHASIIFLNDVEIRLKLTDYVIECYETAHCDYDPSLLSNQIEELRARLNDTPFHKVELTPA